MKKHTFIKTAVKSGTTFLLLMFLSQVTFAQEKCIQAGGPDQIKGTQNNYSYELWSQDSKQVACMTVGSGALFSGRWSTGIENYLGRRGLSYDSTKTPSEIGYFDTLYRATYTPGCESGGNSYMGVYGWTREPLIEYYIVENWCNWNPSMDPNATHHGFHIIDDEFYEVYSVLRKNAPNITGTNQDFMQYFSIKVAKSKGGTINISKHFDIWKGYSLPLGKLHEVSFLVEGYKSSGSYSFSKLEVNKRSTPYIAWTSFGISPKTKTLKVGQTVQMTTSFNPSNATDKRVTYSSYNSTIASVSSSGLVTAKKAGKTNIKVMSYDGTYQIEAVFTITN